MIKGGENISPREIEEAIYAHPAVAEAAVVGVPDAVYGENLLAAVVLKAGQTLTEEALKEHLAAHVTKFKIPARVVLLDALPKGSTGKIFETGDKGSVQRLSEIKLHCDRRVEGVLRRLGASPQTALSTSRGTPYPHLPS